MTVPHATFAGLALIALAIFAGHFATPAGSQVARPQVPLTSFLPMTTYGQNQGDQAHWIWRMDAQNGKVSLCTAGTVTEVPACSPWSKAEPVQRPVIN